MQHHNWASGWPVLLKTIPEIQTNIKCKENTVRSKIVCGERLSCPSICPCGLETHYYHVIAKFQNCPNVPAHDGV